MEFEHDIDGLFKTYQSLLPMNPEDEARLWQKFRLDWNYNSNRIEGNTLTYGETEALLILGTEPKRLQKDIREMKAHDVGIVHLQNLAQDARPISETDIRELNRIILKENYFIETETAEGNISRKEIVPGTYKTMPNHVRLRGGGIHKFAEPHEVPQRMEAVVKSIRNYVSKPANQPLAEYLAELHQDFINTHPFDDGNGRVMRMLLNYVCLKPGWPPVIIKNAKKTDYLAALEQRDKGEKEPLRLLMHTELMWSLDKSVKAARGEDIEDPDDIDKEIHSFVQEMGVERLSEYKSDQNIFWVMENIFNPIFETLLEKSKNLDPLFAEISSDQNLPFEFDTWDELLSSGEHSSSVHMKQFSKTSETISLVLYLTIKFFENEYTLKSKIRAFNSDMSLLSRWKSTAKNIAPNLAPNNILEERFLGKRYGSLVEGSKKQKFCSKTLKNVLDLIQEIQHL